MLMMTTHLNNKCVDDVMVCCRLATGVELRAVSYPTIPLAMIMSSCASMPMAPLAEPENLRLTL